MRIVKALSLSLLVASLFSSLSFAAQQDRISGSLASGQSHGLKGNVRHQALPQYDQGRVDPAMRLGTMTLLTAPTAAQQSAIKQLLAQQQDRKSPNHHKWITPEQYADRFGLSQNDMQQLVAWLSAQGFTMIEPAHGRNWISFTGTAAQVETAFGTEIHHYNVKGELHYANATAPQIPAALAGIVTGVRGLDDFHPRPMGVRRARPDYFYNGGTYTAQYIAPGDIYTIYDINPLHKNGIDGSGQILAIMGATDIYLSDLNDFRTGFGLPAISCTAGNPPNDLVTACSDPHFSYVLGGADPGPVGGNTLEEADLDLEWSGAIAPGAQIIFVNSTDAFTSFYYAIDNQSTLGETVISLSFGGCEFEENIGELEIGQPALFETELQKANTEGITFVNSSGDSGAAECDDNSTLTATGLATGGLAVAYPASSPEVTGVGGTAIPLADIIPPPAAYWGQANGANGGSILPNGPGNGYIPEQTWNDDDEFAQYCQQFPGLFCSQGGTPPQSGWVPITSSATAQDNFGIGAGGGGASNCAVQNADFSACVSGFPQPAWQTVTISGQTTRMSPDVSLLATPNFPGFVYCTQVSGGSSCANGIPTAVGDFSIIGGTSASAPIFAGIVTLLNQYLPAGTPPGLGNINQTLYSLAKTQANGAFNPVTTGENTAYCEEGQPSVQPPALRCPSTGPTAGLIGFQASNADSATGFNLATGLGSVNSNHLAVAWAATLPAGFSLAPTAASYQVSQGSNASVLVTVQVNGSFNGTVAFQCADPAPESICTSPAQGITTTQTVSFNITTSAPTAALRHPSSRGTGILYAALLPGLFGLMLTAGTRRRSLRGMRLLGLILVMGFSTMWLASCGGSSGGNSNPGTPVGNYTITLTATSGSSTVTSTVQLDVVK